MVSHISLTFSKLGKATKFNNNSPTKALKNVHLYKGVPNYPFSPPPQFNFEHFRAIKRDLAYAVRFISSNFCTVEGFDPHLQIGVAVIREF